MFNKQGMIFNTASAILTNGRYPYIYSSAVVKESVSNRFTNCHTYYYFISAQKLKTYQSHDMVHVPGKVRENTAMCHRVTAKMEYDEQYLLSRAFGTAGDNKMKLASNKLQIRNFRSENDILIICETSVPSITKHIYKYMK